MEPREKTRENRLRRVAARRGLVLQKSRRRDPWALDYGAYWLLDEETSLILNGQYGMDLDGIEEWLSDRGRT
jgi:hypothetical protein